uniref:Uncharacterized protein n=1 Tax=Rhizophora mucronata TaxID=61149 RepID=A0A2P2KU09_RHIMU
MSEKQNKTWTVVFATDSKLAQNCTSSPNVFCINSVVSEDATAKTQFK